MAKWTALKLEDSQSCLLLRKIWGNDIVMTLIGFIFDKQKNNCDKDFILLATFITIQDWHGCSLTCRCTRFVIQEVSLPNEA